MPLFIFVLPELRFFVWNYGFKGLFWRDALYLVVGYLASAAILGGNLHWAISQRVEQRQNSEHGDITLTEQLMGSERIEKITAKAADLLQCSRSSHWRVGLVLSSHTTFSCRGEPATGAKAEQRTIYGSDGKVASRSVTGSNGAVTHYGSDGKVIGREITTRSSTTVYDAAGRRIGSTTPPAFTKKETEPRPVTVVNSWRQHIDPLELLTVSC